MGSDVLIPAGYRVSSVRSEPHWIRVQEPPGGPPEAAEAPQAPQPRHTTRAVRPPPCGTG
ncbi:hypothetical protein PIB30_115713, partial [Stylosanthes scabra]|nr:hypothetical protein [Stylosanthes scabra]